MADLQQYPLPNPGLPLGQQAVSPVAQTNPLQALAQGGIQGFSLGLAARQQAALEQERQVQLMAAQQQAKLAQQQALTNAASITHQNFEDLTKVDPDHAVDYYNQAIAPLHQAILAQYGVHMDVGQMPASHKNADSIDKINSYVDMLKDPNKAPIALQGLNRISNEMDIAQSTREKASAGMKTVEQIQDYNKNVQGLEKDARAGLNGIRGDQNFQKLESQRNGAAGVYSLLRQNQDEKGNYNLTKQQLVDLNSKLYTSLNGASPTAEALHELSGSNYASLYSELAAKVGLARNALPKEIGDRLLKMSEDAGTFAEAQHDSMLSGRLSQMGTQLPEDIKQKIINDPSTRGQSFQQMKAIADKQSKYQPNIPQFKSTTEAENSNVPKGTIVMINGKKYRKD